VPFFLPPLLAALVLAALTFVVSFPVSLRSLRIDLLGLFLLLFALVTLRLAFRQAEAGSRASGVRAPLWFWPAAFVVAALIAFRAVHALSG
jgi:hypothetical protein